VVKGGRCVRLTTLPPSCAVVMKSGNLNFLEPSGPLQASNGSALPLHSYNYSVIPCERITSPILICFEKGIFCLAGRESELHESVVFDVVVHPFFWSVHKAV